MTRSGLDRIAAEWTCRLPLRLSACSRAYTRCSEVKVVLLSSRMLVEDVDGKAVMLQRAEETDVCAFASLRPAHVRCMRRDCHFHEMWSR